MVFDIRYKEDLLLFREWFIRVLLWHCDSVFSAKPTVDTHVVTVGRHEIDVVVNCGGKRICIELKEHDIDRAVNQAINYMENLGCDIVYVALGMHIDTIMDYLRTRPDLAKRIFEHGIGIVSAPDNCIVFRAFQRRTASSKFLSLLELMKSRDNE